MCRGMSRQIYIFIRFWNQKIIPSSKFWRWNRPASAVMTSVALSETVHCANLAPGIGRNEPYWICSGRLEMQCNTSLCKWLMPLTCARQWVQNYAPEKGGGQDLPPPTNSAPMKARITKFLWELVWLKIYIVCNFGNPRSISSMLNKFEVKKILKLVENADIRVFRSRIKTIKARNEL